MNKIKVQIKTDNKNIKLPSIPFWLIPFLGSIGLKIASIVLKSSKKIDKETKKYISLITPSDLKDIFNGLKSNEPYDIIHIIVEGEDTEVKISVL